MRSVLHNHAWAASCAVLAAAWLCLPNALMAAQRRFFSRSFPGYFATWTDNGRFSALDSFSMSDDSYYYAARSRQTAEHAIPGDPYIRGRRSRRLALTDVLTWEAFSVFWRLLGDSRRAWMASQFVFALLWLPLLYALLLRLGAARGPAVLFAALFTLYADLARVLVFTNARPLGILKDCVQYAFWFLGSYQYFIGPTRATGPLFTYPCLFLAALTFTRGAERGGRGALALGGVLGGLLAYVHVDIFLAFEGASALFALWRLRKGDRRPALMWGLSVLVAVPWLIFCRPTPQDVALLGLRPGRVFYWYTLAFPAGAWLAFKRSRGAGLGFWCSALLVAMFFAANTPLVTGWYLIQGHWFYIGNTFLALVLAEWLASKAAAWEESDWRWATALVFLLALPRSVSYAALHYKVNALPAAEEAGYDWVNENLPDGAVVAALSPQTDFRLSAHTRATLTKSFLFPIISDVPIAENAQRLIYTLSLFGVKLDDYLRAGDSVSEKDWSDRLWLGDIDQGARERAGMVWLYFCWMPREQIRALLEATAKQPVRDFGAEYLWVGPFEKSFGPRLPRKLTKVFENQAATIYRLGR